MLPNGSLGRASNFTTQPPSCPPTPSTRLRQTLGVEFVIGVSAVGSLREEIVPGQVVLVDQFIDRTQHRHHTFFEKGQLPASQDNAIPARRLWTDPHQ